VDLLSVLEHSEPPRSQYFIRLPTPYGKLRVDILSDDPDAAMSQGLVGEDAERANAMVNEAVRRAQRSEFVSAEELLLETVRYYPYCYDAYGVLCDVSLSLGRTNDAVYFGRQVVALVPSYHNLTRLGRALGQDGKLHEAATVQYHLWQVRHETGREEALEAIHGYLVTLAKLDDPGPMTDVCAQALREYPGDPTLLYQLAYAFLLQGRLAEAHAVAERALQTLPLSEHLVPRFVQIRDSVASHIGSQRPALTAGPSSSYESNPYADSYESNPYADSYEPEPSSTSGAYRYAANGVNGTSGFAAGVSPSTTLPPGVIPPAPPPPGQAPDRIAARGAHAASTMPPGTIPPVPAHLPHTMPPGTIPPVNGTALSGAPRTGGPLSGAPLTGAPLGGGALGGGPLNGAAVPHPPAPARTPPRHAPPDDYHTGGYAPVDRPSRHGAPDPDQGQHNLERGAPGYGPPDAPGYGAPGFGGPDDGGRGFGGRDDGGRGYGVPDGPGPGYGTADRGAGYPPAGLAAGGADHPGAEQRGYEHAAERAGHRAAEPPPFGLADIIAAVEAGNLPPADGGVTVVPGEGHCAILGFTAHAVIAADVDPDWVRELLPPGDLGAPLNPPFLTALAQRTRRTVNNIDITMLAPRLTGRPPLPLSEITGRRHPRIRRALRYREEVHAWATEGGILVLGRGVGGRWELAVEVDEEYRGGGLGRTLAAAGRHLVPGEMIWAQIAPGNAASVRAFLAAGFTPIGSEALLVD
jgi:tetratricopeptide (TPR) repeat protein